MHEVTTDDLGDEDIEEPQYLALPLYESRQCKQERLGVRCTNMATWQFYDKPAWTPICIMHMQKLLSGYRAKRIREEEDFRLYKIAWRKTARLPGEGEPGEKLDVWHRLN